MSIFYNVQDFGACPDGRTMNTAALQSAIDTCHEAGGGVVLCEAGVYRTGSIELKSNVELHLASGCTLLGSTDPDDYRDLISEGFRHDQSPEGTATYLIGAQHAKHIAVTGSGEINASGPSFFDASQRRPDGSFAKKPEQRPRLMMMHRCSDVRLEGVSLIDSPCWTAWLMQCERVTIHRIRILGDQRMINNDGIDLDACRDVTVSDCMIRTDDDCIVVRAIQKLYDTPAVCENIVVTNCILESTCQCVRVSCPSDHITRNVAFSNLVMRSRANGINFDFPNRYLAKGSRGSADVSNISFSNSVIDCKAHPVRIEVQEGIRLTRVSDISFSDMRITSIKACVIRGNPESIIEDVSFANITMRSSGEQALVCAHCRGVKLHNVDVTNTPDVEPTAVDYFD